jgi:hypothetical protein
LNSKDDIARTSESTIVTYFKRDLLKTLGDLTS